MESGCRNRRQIVSSTTHVDVSQELHAGAVSGAWVRPTFAGPRCCQPIRSFQAIFGVAFDTRQAGSPVLRSIRTIGQSRLPKWPRQLRPTDPASVETVTSVGSCLYSLTSWVNCPRARACVCHFFSLSSSCPSDSFDGRPLPIERLRLSTSWLFRKLEGRGPASCLL